MDRALISMVHDVLRSPSGLRHVLDHVVAGGRVVAAGAKFVPAGRWWASLLNPLVAEVNKPYVTSFEGFHEPWDHLAKRLDDLTVYVDPWQVTYVVSGFRAPARRS